MTMSELSHLRCVACRGDEPRLKEDEIVKLKPEVPEWQVIEDGEIKKLERNFKFKNFKQALAFTDQVGGIAEEEDHHPLIQTEWGKVKVMWWTHKIRGLHRNDFIMAAKTDALYAQATAA
jgi:4a-hydroxytetrahydrobiopterin dehydratase